MRKDLPFENTVLFTFFAWMVPMTDNLSGLVLLSVIYSTAGEGGGGLSFLPDCSRSVKVAFTRLE